MTRMHGPRFGAANWDWPEPRFAERRGDLSDLARTSGMEDETIARVGGRCQRGRRAGQTAVLPTRRAPILLVRLMDKGLRRWI